MRRSTFPILLTGALAAVSTLAAPGAAPGGGWRLSAPFGAGSESGGWVELAYPDTITKAPGLAVPKPPSHQLYFLPINTPPGALYGVMELPEAPHAIAASGERVVMLFPPNSAAKGSGADGWLVRALTAFNQPEPLPPVFDPVGRLEVLPALQTEGEVVGFSGSPGGGVAALIRPVADATGKTVGGNYSLMALIDGSWRSIPLPEAIAATRSCRLLPVSDGFLLLVPDDAPPPARLTIWRGVVPRSPARDTSTIELDWTRSWISQADSDAPLTATTPIITVIGDHLLQATRSEDGVVRLTLRLAGSSTLLAVLNKIPNEFALIRVGDTAALVYLSDESTPRIMTAVVHASTGEILYQGPHVRVPPVSGEDLRFLGFVLALVLMTALVFVLRPAAASKSEVMLPPGTALASPERRLAAGLIDFAIPLVMVVEVWGVGLLDVLLAPIRAQRADEFWPFAVVSVAFFAHTVASEWLSDGRTLGKFILRIRVASITGDRLTLWQCVCRDTIKLVCPPLMLLIFADPRRRHPGDTLAGAVVVARARGPEPPVDDDQGPSRGNEAPVADG
jgi:uncharacterized RDD family membrane protein YckC